MRQEIKDILDSIDSFPETENIIAVLSKLKDKTDDKFLVLSDVETLGYNILRILKDRNDLYVKAQMLQEHIDRGLQKFIVECLEGIDNYSSSILAVETFNVDWFKSLPFSANCQTQLANEIIKHLLDYIPEDRISWVLRYVSMSNNIDSLTD